MTDDERTQQRIDYKETKTTAPLRSECSYLLACPCGKVPNDVFVVEGDSCKRAYVAGICCGEWHIEFRTNYEDLKSEKCKKLAIKAWNEAPRAAAS